MPERLSAKEKRMMKAARLKHMDNMSYSEIAEHVGVAEGTVRNYFASDEMDQFKRFYSDQELFKLEQSLEQDVRDGNKLANNLLARAIQSDDVGPQVLLRAAKEAQRIRERKVDLLQELGVIDGDDSEDEDASDDGFDDLRREIAEGLREKRKQEESKGVEAE